MGREEDEQRWDQFLALSLDLYLFLMTEKYCTVSIVGSTAFLFVGGVTDSNRKVEYLIMLYV